MLSIPAASRRPSRARGATLVAVAALLASVLSSVASLPSDAPPAGAATAAPRLLRSVDVRLNSIATSPGSNEYTSSPALADLNHPADDKPELVVAAPNGTITATRVDTGARVWQASLGATVVHASPVVTDVDNDGRVDVVVATMDGRVVLLNGQTGAVKRTFRQGADLHCPASRPNCRPTGFYATPVVADVNGDGRNDIVAPSFDHTVYAWSVGGTLLWRSFLHDTLWSSPAVVDVDRNGTPEVVLGGDIYAGNPLGVPAGGLLWVLNGRNGTRHGSSPRSLPGQTIWSSPAITDLNGDGWPDAVVGTGNNGPFGDGAAARRVWAVRLSNLQHLPGWPITAPGRVVHQPAVGDIDGDARPEVVVATETGYVRAYEHTGAAKWTACNLSAAGGTGCSTSTVAHTHGGVVIADVDDDGVQEVVSTLAQRLRVYDGRWASPITEAEVRLSGGNGLLSPASVAAVSEINGSTVIAQSYINRDPGATGAPQAGRAAVRTDLYTTDAPLCAEDWPAFKRDTRRSSVRPTRPAWHPFPCGRPFVAQQYRDLLGRELDTAGATFWTARLRTTWSGPRVVEGFMNSAEFGVVASPVVRLHLGLLTTPPTDPREIIDADQVRAQMLSLRQGASLTSVATGLLAQVPHASLTDGQLVDRAFANLMGRSPTPTERTAALAAIATGGRGAWLAELSSSTWAVGRLRGPVQVAMTYIGLLRRGPEKEGWDYWVARVAAGTSPQRLIELFLASDEYSRRVL